MGLSYFDGFVHTAAKTPSLEVTTTAATSTHGPVVKIEGKLGFGYTAYDVADDTTFDLTGMTSYPKDNHPTATVFTAGQQPKPPANLRIVGGVIHGKIPLEWSWTLTHAFGGSAFLTCANGLQSLEGVRIHNTQDGYWEKKDDALAAQVKQNWTAIEALVAAHPYAINWGPVRHTTPRMAGLHPDSAPPKAKKKRVNDLDLN